MKRKLVRETLAGETYEYVPLGKYVVSAPAVCRGRPTFKYTRIEVAGVMERLGAGHSVDQLVAGYRGRISREAIEEAVTLAAKALLRQTCHRAATLRSYWTNSCWAMESGTGFRNGIAAE